jgi:hypothetical protein
MNHFVIFATTVLHGNKESGKNFGIPFLNMIQLQIIRWNMKYKFVLLYYYITLKAA